MPYSEKYLTAPLSAHPKKLIRFAEILATGLYTVAAAAREVGYSPITADKKAYAWVGKSRETSEFPVLWDHYEKLRRERMREFDLTVDSVARELALVAFTDITNFIDLPSADYDQKADKARDIHEALIAVKSYEMQLEEFTRDVQDQAGKRGRKKKLVRPTEPSDRQRSIVEIFLELSHDEQKQTLVWLNYRSGSIRLKNREEIPRTLLPAVAEISETKDGIRLKLHDKLAALDKLARWQKMYDDAKDKGSSGTVEIKEVNFIVKGTKSKLDISPVTAEQAAA